MIPKSQANTRARLRLFRLLFVVPVVLGWITVEDVQAQLVRARITVDSTSPGRILIEGQGPPTDSWSFRNVYSGIVGLGERINSFQTSEGSVEIRKSAPGEFRSNQKVSTFSYEVRVNELKRPADASHVSWLNQERGVLMLGDLLPTDSRDKSVAPAIVEFTLPPGWTIASSIRPSPDQQFIVQQMDDAVFYVGRVLREKSIRLDSMELSLVTSGEWAFSENDALKIATRVMKECLRVTGHQLTGRFVVMLAPYPAPQNPERWSAETRGSTVLLLMEPRTSRKVLLSNLGILFTHELFHFWVPNALALEGDYDWFFEGFTLYQALLTALRLNFIKFEDYLETMGRVYDSYRALPDGDKLSLIEASERRWTTSSSLVYDKGMLVAFLYDLKLRQITGNRCSLVDTYMRLFEGSSERRGNANKVIMSILGARSDMAQFADAYVGSNRTIDLREMLAPYGFRVETVNSKTKITVNKDLTSEQRAVFRALGYES